MQIVDGKFALTVFVVASIVLTCAGCFQAREVVTTRKAVERAVPEMHLEREMEFSLGSGVLRFAGLTGLAAGAFVQDESSRQNLQMARRYLGDIRRVELGIYNVSGDYPIEKAGRLQLPHLSSEYWETLVRINDGDQQVWIIYEDRRPFIRPLFPESRIRDIMVVVLDDDQLVIARLYGDIEGIMRRAAREHMPASFREHIPFKAFDVFGNDDVTETKTAIADEQQAKDASTVSEGGS